MLVIKRIIALILIFSLMFVILSCHSKTVENNQNDEPVLSTGNARYDPELPDKNFGGIDFTFVVRGEKGDPYKWNGTDIVSKGYTGEIIGDSIFKRNSYLEEKYNVVINVYFAGNTNVNTIGSDMYNRVQRAIFSGESDFDAILTSPYDTVGYILSGFVLDLSNVPYIDFQREWWDPNVINMINIGGKTYTATGSLTIIDDKATHTFIFNKNLIKNFNLDDPYTVVKDGEWTFEKLITDSRAVTADIDGDGVMTEKDRYGFHYWQDAVFTFLCSTGNSFGKLINGYPELTLNTPKTIDVWEKMIDFVREDSTFTNYDYYNVDGVDLFTMISNDRVLYGWTTIADIIDLRQIFGDFGIIPAPKYNTSQENYITSPHSFGNTLLTIPKITRDIEDTGFFLEAFSAKSAELLTPAFYEIVLKSRTAQDQESAEMLDIIFSTKYYDIGLFFMWGDYGNVMMDAFNEKSRNFVTEYLKHEKAALNDMQKLVDYIVLN